MRQVAWTERSFRDQTPEVTNMFSDDSTHILCPNQTGVLKTTSCLLNKRQTLTWPLESYVILPSTHTPFPQQAAILFSARHSLLKLDLSGSQQCFTLCTSPPHPSGYPACISGPHLPWPFPESTEKSLAFSFLYCTSKAHWASFVAILLQHATLLCNIITWLQVSFSSLDCTLLEVYLILFFCTE